MDLFLFSIVCILFAAIGILTYLGVQLNSNLQLETSQRAAADANHIAQPTSTPSKKPLPSVQPTSHPSKYHPPTFLPSSSVPSINPTAPSVIPTLSPSVPPTAAPSFSPTTVPTTNPSFRPTTTSAPSTTGKPSTLTPTFKATSGTPTESPTTNILTSIASWTYYDIYPKCCPGDANYDPSYPTTECIEDNGCENPGKLAGIGYRTLNYVQETNLIAFYDNSDPDGLKFYTKYANKYINITGTCNGITKTFTAIVGDTCGNEDCANCCQTNSNPNTGYLIDMDFYTVLRNFGSASCATGNLHFSINLSQPPAIQNCGGSFGACNGLLCCGEDSICGAGREYCGAGCQVGYGFCASTPNSCGPNGNICPSETCCSQYGYCGNTTSYCGLGCLSDAGRCNKFPTPAPIWYPTFAPTPKP